MARKRTEIERTAIGLELERLRGRTSLAEMAAKVGCHKNTLANYERGKRVPPLEFLRSFAAATGAELEDLYGITLWPGEGLETKRRGDGKQPEPAPAAQGPTQELDQELLIEISAKLLKKRIESADFGLAAVRFYAEHQAAIREALQAVREGKVQESEAFIPLVQKLQSRFMHMAVMHAAFVAVIYNEVVRMGSQAARTRGIDERAASYAAMLGRVGAEP